MSETESSSVGARLTEWRRYRKMSLRDLAKAAKCSPSYLSQVETGQMSPTLKNLEKVCRALKTTVSDLLRHEPLLPPLLIPSDRSASPIAMSWSQARMRHLLPEDTAHAFTALLLQIDPRGVMPPRRSVHPLMQAGLVITGRAECRVEQNVHSLETGGGIYFDLSLPHQWSNPGDTPAEILLTGGGAFFLFEQLEEDVQWMVRIKRLRRTQKK